MKLISMTDFVLEQDLNYPVGRTAREMIKYGLFLKQPLILGMFVPCDLDGNVLEYPVKNGEFDNNKLCEYERAKERCLFEGSYERSKIPNELCEEILLSL